jgi:hypothetical protein
MTDLLAWLQTSTGAVVLHITIIVGQAVLAVLYYLEKRNTNT